jgi:Protein of unknown function (DUF3108)
MKNLSIKFLFVLSAVALVSVNKTGAIQSNDSNAQTSAVITSPPNYPLATLRRDFKGSLPIPAGEKLEYEVKFSRFPLYLNVGVVTFEYLGPVDLKRMPKQIRDKESTHRSDEPLIEGLNIEFNSTSDDSLLRLRASAVSKGMLLSLLGYDVKDRFEALVDANDFSARLAFMEIKENKQHTTQSAVFDRASEQVKYLTTDLANPGKPPREKVLPYQDGMSSLLPVLYFIRLQKYKEGQMFRIPVSYDEKNYQFDILVGKREKIKTDCGKVKTVRLEPKLFGGRFFRPQGEMTIWLSEDRRRIPLRLIAKTSSGTVSAKLIKFKNNCKIEDPEMEETAEDKERTQDNQK